MRIRILLSMLFLTGMLFAQAEQDRLHEYVAFYTASSSTSNKVTIQQPASGSRTVSFREAYVECSVACTATVQRDGTAATATAITPVKVNATNASGSTVPVATAKAYRSSDVGAGTTISPAYAIPANGWKLIDLAGKVLYGDGAAINLTVAVASGSSGNLSVIVKWEEY